MRRRRAVVAGGVLIIVGILVAWAQARVVRVRPGEVRFEVVSLLGDRINNYGDLDGMPLDGVLEVREGEHALSLTLVEDMRSRPIELSRSVRAQGPRATEVQTVTLRVAPWNGLRQRLAAKWDAYQARRGFREVTVRVLWADGGVVNSFVSCAGQLKETDASGRADCGEHEGDVKVMAWKDWYSPMVVAIVPADESELELRVEPTRDGGVE